MDRRDGEGIMRLIDGSILKGSWDTGLMVGIYFLKLLFLSMFVNVNSMEYLSTETVKETQKDYISTKENSSRKT